MDEDTIVELEYPQPEVTHCHFTFGPSGFQVDSISRASPRALKRKLFPERLKSKEARKKAERDASSSVNNRWIMAQLRHYDLNFASDISPSEAKALLRTSVADGLCDTVPHYIAPIETMLKKEYKVIDSSYRARLEGHHNQERAKRIQAFENCTNPTDEVKCDANLFLHKYFINDNGISRRVENGVHRVSDLILLLPGYTDDQQALTWRTERVPALYVAHGGIEGEDSVMVIGWDRAKVVEKANEIDMQQSQGRGVSRHDDWDRLMEAHYALVNETDNQTDNQNEETRRSNQAALDSSANDPFEPRSGIFILSSDAVQNDWPTLTKQMRLRILGNKKAAVFDLGIICGLMVFGKTQEDLTKILKKGEFDRRFLEDVPNRNDEEEDESEEEEYIDSEESASSEDEKPTMSNRSSNSNTSISERPAKRQKMEESSPRRVYFQWRGHTTTPRGTPQYDRRNRNIGYLDFMDDGARSFEGNIYGEIFGRSISFKGYQIPGECGPLTMNWHALSHSLLERAIVPRWEL